MTTYIQPNYPTHHLGVERAENAVTTAVQAVKSMDGARGVATFVLAAVVSGLLFAANQMMESWSDGHLLAAWMILWVVAFAVLALLAAPIRRAIQHIKNFDGSALYAAWSARRKARLSDQKMWDYARDDYRLRAELARALDN